ncbi:Sensor histidine kinase RcsC [subsurface metagenome]
MKIKNRLYISAGISIVLVVILISLVLVTSDRIAEESKKHELLDNVRGSVSELDIITYDYLLHREKRMVQQWNLKYNSLGEILEKTEEEVMKSIGADYAALGDLFSQITTNYKARQKSIQEGASQERIDTAIGLEERLVAQLLIKSHSLITNATRLAEEAQAEVMEAQRLAANLTLILMIILAITVTTASLLIARSISEPLDELAKGVGIIGKGDLEHKVEIKAKDELGELAAAFNKMTQSLKKITASRDELDREVTERKKAEEDVKKHAEQLEQANIRLQELDLLKSMFIASMSHELRTPLNSIIGFTGIILQGMSGEITEDQRKELTMVKNSANHLLILINDVIDVSKIETDKVELFIEEFNLADLMQEVKESFKVAADEKNLKLSLKMPERLIIKGDERRTKQVIMNLVSNAVKFTDGGEIEIKVKKKEEEVEVSVIDTGIGIKKENMEKLFKQFSRIYAEDKPVTEGTGLGLYLSKKIVDLLGGQIKAESEFGKGSMFTFTFPLEYREVKT